jgi:DNA polymerase III delta prime subunit
MSKDFIWSEKHRPRKISETILPVDLKETFQQMVTSGEVQNMLFSGSAGLGKTTVARAICDELELDYIIINASEEGNIDTLRGKIRKFASSIALTGGYKVVILDESDYLNAQSTQPALRGFIQDFSDNCRFILTCNFKNRIIEPLHSRCGVYEFNTTKKDLQDLCGQFFNRSMEILDSEGVSYQKDQLAELIMKYAPDWRRVLNECQRNSIDGVLKLNSMSGSISDYDVLFDHIKAKDFKKVRAWVVNNIDVDAAAIFRAIYDRMFDRVDAKSIPHLVLILADYQYKNAFVADHELNVVACLTEIMATVEMK